MNMNPVEHAPIGYRYPWNPLIVVPLSTGDSRETDGTLRLTINTGTPQVRRVGLKRWWQHRHD